MENTIKVIIEISKNSNIKYEYDNKENKIVLDRILHGSNIYPENYGFIPNTLDYDGDPLDALLISNYALLPGTIVRAKIIGVMYMIDEGEVDNKLICVIDGDSEYSQINNLDEMNDFRIKKIKDFFTNYKILENKKVKIKNFSGRIDGNKVFNECIEIYNKNKKFINKLSKKELVNLINNN